MSWLQNKFEKNFLISTVDYVFNWARKSAVWPMTFGLACCAIEMIASSTARFDIARFGAEGAAPVSAGEIEGHSPERKPQAPAPTTGCSWRSLIVAPVVVI